MDSPTITAITTGIYDAQSIFYEIGGSILVTLAAIWAFHKVSTLLGFNSVKDNDPEYKP